MKKGEKIVRDNEMWSYTLKNEEMERLLKVLPNGITKWYFLIRVNMKNK